MERRKHPPKESFTVLRSALEPVVPELSAVLRVGRHELGALLRGLYALAPRLLVHLDLGGVRARVRVRVRVRVRARVRVRVRVR